MVERHGTKTAVFGGKPGEQVEYKGMAGNQVLEWADLDSEVKTAHLKSVSAFDFCWCCDDADCCWWCLGSLGCS